jgi:phosphohistidine swiveling domain-containing protein
MDKNKKLFSDLAAPDNYQLLFRVSDYKSTCLMSEFLVKGSLGFGDPIVINHQGRWAIFVRKDKLDDIHKKGLSVFGDTDKFEKYRSDFEEYIRDSEKKVLSKYSKPISNMTFEEYPVLIAELEKFWTFYGMTEFVYHDYSYQYATETGNKEILRNLDALVDLKTRGRKIWDKYVSKGGVVPNLLEFVSKKYLYAPDDGQYLFTDEIEGLLKGRSIPKELIDSRRESYLVVRSGRKTLYFDSDKSFPVTFNFFESEAVRVERNAGQVKGMTACEGEVRGRVRVVPMYNLEDAIKAASEMSQGEILIAQSTNPNLVTLMKKAGAIVTDQGGLLSHAAILSRELNIPCVVGTSDATKVFKTGDMVLVDATHGIIQRLG